MTETIPPWAKQPDFHKAWLYCQGTWQQVDDPVNELPDDVESPLGPLFYDEENPITYEMASVSRLIIYRRRYGAFVGDATPVLPRYPFHVELVIDEHQVFFYIADEPGYIQLLPHLLEIIERVGRLRRH